MEYDLAKELMDAGFTQGGNGSWAHPKDAIVIRSGDRVYVPTLEELIEACREGFYTLEKKDSRFEAHSNIYNDYWSGLTPAEAVARLWLALNKR
jgi:hypothetical protein